MRQCISSARVCSVDCEDVLFSFFRFCTRPGTCSTIWINQTWKKFLSIYPFITIKGTGHSRKLLHFLSSPLASKHFVFPLTKLSASKAPNNLKKFTLNDWLWRLPFWNCLGSQAGFMWGHSISLKIEKPATDSASFSRSANLFFNGLFTSLSSI